MADYISRDAVLELVEPDARPFLAERVRNIPSADVAPVRHGKWEMHRIGWDLLQCTACKAIQNCNDYGEYYMHRWKFCPNCGARMFPTLMSGTNEEDVTDD